jgi:hypothetical protein
MANDKPQTSQQQGQQQTREGGQQGQSTRSKGPSGSPAVKKR